MKKLYIAIGLALGLLLPFEALAAPGHDITIRLMQMNEKSTVDVMNNIKLPIMATDKVTEGVPFRSREKNRVSDTQGKAKYYATQGPGESQFLNEENSQHETDMEQERERDQDRVMEMEQEHNEIENALEEPRQGSEPPEDPRSGPGLGG